MEKKKKGRKIRLGGIIFILLIIYLAGMIFVHLWNTPMKGIVINGNSYLKDNYLINYLDIENESILKVKRSSIKKKLLKLDLITDVHIHKSLLGILTINVTEDKVLFYNRESQKLVLSSGKEIENNNEYLGIPSLINHVKDDVYDEFVDKLNRVDKDILAMVSEIEYSPSEINEKIVDDKRFLFRMNDGNTVYINTINIEKINNYTEIYEAVMNKNGVVKGCLYLDSNSENKHFGSCDTEKKVVEEEKVDEN